MTFSPGFEETFLMYMRKLFQHKRFLAPVKDGLTRFQTGGQPLSEPLLSIRPFSMQKKLTGDIHAG
jgi:hypothetical protein